MKKTPGMASDSLEVNRLGKRELGRHAFEKRMPDSIAELLATEDGKSNTLHPLPIVAGLLREELAHHNGTAYLCSADIIQVWKLKQEGAHFCGYRNVQMILCSLELDLRASLPPDGSCKGIYTISEVQDMIETAWTRGFNVHGRIQTGGIRDTRKHIGTSEAEAILLSLDVPCTGTGFHGDNAYLELLDHIENYFSCRHDPDSDQSVCWTRLPPVFFQRPGHSITIVGIERRLDGSRCLLTFDPAWRPPVSLMQTCPKAIPRYLWRRHVLSTYRKSERYLRRFKDFEILTVDTRLHTEHSLEPNKNG